MTLKTIVDYIGCGECNSLHEVAICDMSGTHRSDSSNKFGSLYFENGTVFHIKTESEVCNVKISASKPSCLKYTSSRVSQIDPEYSRGVRQGHTILSKLFTSIF